MTPNRQAVTARIRSWDVPNMVGIQIERQGRQVAKAAKAQTPGDHHNETVLPGDGRCEVRDFASRFVRMPLIFLPWRTWRLGVQLSLPPANEFA